MANARERGLVRLLGVTGRRRSDLLISTALQATTLLVLSAPSWAQPAPNARPTGGSVVAGSAMIAQSSSATTIDQSTERAAIDWRSFNIGSAQRVTFAQPSASSATLNRVTGPDPSQIAGKINANGQVVLVNQAGVTFYKGAQVNAQSFIVSTANVGNQNFMAGKLVLDRPGSPNAGVSNQGTITVKQAGLAALVAPNVANSGVINARLGHVVLAGAKTATIDLYGDGLLSLDVGNQVTKAPVGPGGKTVTALVTNSGVINADGGTVQLTAAAADGVLQTLVRAGGTVTANSAGIQTGAVTIAGIGGSVTVTGLQSASGQAAGTMGGQIAVNATGAVTLASTARIDASGMAGGGTVAIGTTLQRAIGGPGTTATMTAAKVTVRKGASINASATKTGNGGRVAVLSSVQTVMHGMIAATGGSQSGNGGFVEVSGGALSLTPTVYTTAPHGASGTLLLDPANLDIVATEPNPGSGIDGEFVTSSGTSTLGSGAADGNPPPSAVLASTLAALGANNNVVVQANGTIDVQAAVTVTNNLTMQAGGNLTIEAGAPVQAGGNILLQSGTVSASGGIVVNANVTSTDGSVQMIAGNGGIALNGNVFGASVDLSATGGGITQAGGVGITANSLLSSNGVTGNVGLLGNNAVLGLDQFTVTPSSPGQGNFQLVDTAALLVTGQVSVLGGDVYLQTSNAGGMSIASTGAIVTAASGLASFRADFFTILTNISPPGSGSVTTGTFELAPFSAGNAVVLGPSEGILILPSLAGITSTSIRIGAVTQPPGLAPGATAGSIIIGAQFDAQNRNVELDATGPIDGSLAPLINVGTLSGTGGVWTLSSNNTIAHLGDITATSFGLTNNTGLTVDGALNGGATAVIIATGDLTVNGGVSGAAVSLTAADITIPGEVTDGGAGTVALVANVGTISETGALIAGTLSGTAVGVADLLGAGPSINQIATVATPGIPGTNVTARDLTGSSVALRDGVGLTVGGKVSATGATGQVFLESTAAAGITIATKGAVTANAATGTASLQADSLTVNGAAIANTIELAPATAGGLVTLGATGGGLSLASMAGVVATNLLVGAVTQPNAGAPTITAGAITIGGAFAFTGKGTLTLDTASSTAPGAPGTVTQSAPLSGVPVLTGVANSFTLTNPGNTIGIAINMTATSGDLSLVSALALTADVVSAPQGNVFLGSSAPGGVAVVGAVSAQGRVGIQADSLSLALGNVTAATFELAPFTAGNTVTLGLGSPGLSLVSLSGITAGTVRVGAVTMPGGGTPTITAGAVTIAGPFNAAATTTLELDASSATTAGASGAITQAAALTNVGTLAATGDGVVLSDPNNQIGASSGITATNGNVVLVDDPTLLLTGPYNGNNLFFQVTQAGGSLALGNGVTPATLTAASGGRISLVADSMTATAASTIAVPLGTVELAPLSAINESVAGTNNSGQLLVDATLLSDITPGGTAPNTLLIGGYTALLAAGAVAPNGTAPLISASGVTLDGALNLTNRATTLRLLSNGSVTEPGGPLTVTNVTGSSAGTFSLVNPANAIAQSLGITAANGDVVLVDSANLALLGAQSGNNLFFEVAISGGTLQIGTIRQTAPVTAASGGRITLVADQITENGKSRLTAPSGTLELAPFSAINTSLLGVQSTGQLTIDATLLRIVTPGISTLVVGGFTNVPAGASVSSPSAGSVTIDGAVTLVPLASTLDLEATGAVTQSAPIVNVGTLLGRTGSTALNNAGNTVGTLGNYTASTNFALTNAAGLLIAGQVVAGQGASFTVNGALTETGGITANRLTGSAIGSANLTGNNTVAELDNFAVSGTQSSFALNDNGNLLINGSLSAMRITVSDPASRISLANGSTIVTGGSTRPSGLIAPASLLPQNGAPGAFLQAASFTQIGQSTVSGLGGGASSVQISVTGNMQFDPPAGLSAPGTWLTLNLTTGTAAGGVFVNALDVTYGQPGSANLIGSLNGVSGPTAASLGFIQPAPDPRYLFNNCEIATTTCSVSLLTQQPQLSETSMFVPLDALLSLVTPALVLDPDDKDDLLQLPVVSREDY